MVYDKTTYGASPFDKPVKTTQKTVPVQRPTPSKNPVMAPEALSDQVGESQRNENTLPAEEPPELPVEGAPALTPRKRSLSIFYIPKGRLSGLTMFGEAVGWLMAWGTVGFFRAHIPAPVLMVFDRFFSPWGMASATLISALLMGQMLTRYQVKIGALRTFTTTAIEYGESHHRADAQTNIDKLLTQAEEHTETMSRWIVSWLTALGSLFIIGSFY